MLQGNIFNRLDERRKAGSPTVGMGATILMYSDRHAATIVDLHNNRVAIQEDHSIRTDSKGQCDSQSYSYERDTSKPFRWFSLRKNGRYVEEGSKMENGTVLLIGE